MPDLPTAIHLMALLVVLAPAALVIVLGVTSLAERPLSEAAIDRLVRWPVVIALVCALGVFVGMIQTGNRHVTVDLGEWVSIRSGPASADHGEYHFKIKLIYDRLSVPFLALSLVLGGTIGAFAVRYMHRERGFNRFFVLYSIFMLGMVVTALAGTIETLFAGWELVGLSSVLLVAFFQERPAPCRNALRVWVVYRFSDAALLLAAVVLHHMTGGGDLDALTGYREPAEAGGGESLSWPFGECALGASQALLVGALLLAAAAGKSALIPFSGWLPRAMEGPTPSSAVFYGALSVHLGAYMLLRVSPVLDASPTLSAAVVVLGLSTAVFAYLAGSVQTDIKSALSFASLAQVGIIVAEIGVGWRYIPLVHLLGHACLRTLQFIRAPTLLQDYRNLENALGGRLPRGVGFWTGFTPARLRLWLFRFALERGYLDALLADYVVGPFVKLFRWLTRLEQRATDALAGSGSGSGSGEPARPVAATATAPQPLAPEPR